MLKGNRGAVLPSAFLSVLLALLALQLVPPMTGAEPLSVFLALGLLLVMGSVVGFLVLKAKKTL